MSSAEFFLAETTGMPSARNLSRPSALDVYVPDDDDVDDAMNDCWKIPFGGDTVSLCSVPKGKWQKFSNNFEPA